LQAVDKEVVILVGVVVIELEETHMTVPACRVAAQFKLFEFSTCNNAWQNNQFNSILAN
jgi:hypothetical protein